MFSGIEVVEKDVIELLLELRKDKRAPLAAVAASDSITLFLPGSDNAMVYTAKTSGIDAGHGILNALSGVENCQLISEVALTLGIRAGAVPSAMPVAAGDAVVFQFNDSPIETYVLFPGQYGFTPKQVVHFWEMI